jgi:hypothetical protein
LEWTADMFLTNNPSIQKFYCFLKWDLKRNKYS